MGNSEAKLTLDLSQTKAWAKIQSDSLHSIAADITLTEDPVISIQRGLAMLF